MHDEEPHCSPLPTVDALVAGTVALMTIWADPCPDCMLDLASQRKVLAGKVVSNLFILSSHAGLSEGLRRVMGKAHQRWVGLAEPSPVGERPTSDTAPSATALH